MLRIRQTRWKIAYVVASNILLALNGLYVVPLLPWPAGWVIGNALTILFVFVGARSFRGVGEPLTPPRARWRMTSRPLSGFVVGSLFVLSSAANVYSAISMPTNLTFNYVADAVVGGALAFLFLRSSVRMQRVPPETVPEPAGRPRWKPIKR